MKSNPVLLLSCAVKKQPFLHDKPSPTLQFIKGKSRDLQKLLKCISGIVTFTFKNDIDGCAGWSVCPEFRSCANLSGVSPTISVLY